MAFYLITVRFGLCILVDLLKPHKNYRCDRRCTPKTASCHHISPLINRPQPAVPIFGQLLRMCTRIKKCDLSQKSHFCLADVGTITHSFCVFRYARNCTIENAHPSFDNKAGQPAWSPFWDHRTLVWKDEVWKDESAACLLKDSPEVCAALEAGEVDEFIGVPDSHPTSFVVNCPAPSWRRIPLLHKHFV